MDILYLHSIHNISKNVKPIKMKRILLLFIATMMVACSCEIMPDTDVHFVDEDFVLIEKEEREMVVEGDTKNVRFWKIQRVKTVNDSIFVADIDDSGCGCGIITDEVWYYRNVGDVLHFDYIRKSRFIRVKNLAVFSEDYKVVEPVERPNPLSITPTEVKETTVVNMNTMEIERKILEKERALMTLEREIEQLKESLK